MRLRPPDPFPTLTGRHHYPFKTGTAFSVVYDAENGIELSDVDRRAGVTLASAEMIVSNDTGGASILTKSITLVSTTPGTITDDGSTDGNGKMHFDFSGADASWTVPKAFRVNITDSLGRVSEDFDGGYLVPGDYMPPPAPTIDHIEISPTATLLTSGEMQRFAAAAYDVENRPLNDRIITWSSDDEAIAVIDSASGIITALAGGTTKITASSSGVSASATIEVALIDELSFLATFFTPTQLQALYSAEYGVTTSSGVIDNWADARGGGYGPAVNSTGTARPAWDAINKLITFDGVDDYLQSALSALFDTSGVKTIALVGVIPVRVTVDGYAIALAESSSPTRAVAVGGQAGAGDHLFGLVGGNVANSPVTTGSTRRLIVVSKDASTAFHCDVPDAARASNTGSALASGNNALTFGALWPSLAHADAVVRAALVLNLDVSSIQLDALRSWGIVFHDAVPA